MKWKIAIGLLGISICVVLAGILLQFYDWHLHGNAVIQSGNWYWGDMYVDKVSGRDVTYHCYGFVCVDPCPTK